MRPRGERMDVRSTSGRLVRLSELDRPPVTIEIDGRPAAALEGDTLLVALLANVGHIRQSEFGDGPRAGFCFMGACQDCWVWLADGGRVRACTTPVAAGMRIVTGSPGSLWPDVA
jgi:NADH dehydrogenase/NADH:ubiquinone oxidoreductase subunit G